MALFKKIINDSNGLTSSYHRIVSFTRDGQNVIVDVRSYTSKEYRDKEKTYELINAQWSSRREEIEAIIAKPAAERTEEEQALYDEAMDVLNYVQGEGICYLFDNNIGFAEEYLEGNYSIEKMYDILKTIDPYTDAEDA